MKIVLHGRSDHEFLFPGIKASDSRSRIMRMDFFIPFMLPNFGNVFFHSLSLPELQDWNYIHSVPELLKVIPAHPCSKSG